MAASMLLFGDFTKDEATLLLTENQKGFEFVCQGPRDGFRGKNKTEIPRVRGNPAVVPSVVEAVPASPSREAGDQNKAFPSSSRLNVNAPAFVPGRGADFVVSERDSDSSARHCRPEEQSGDGNPAGELVHAAPPPSQPLATPPPNSDAVGSSVSSPQSVGQCSQLISTVHQQAAVDLMSPQGGGITCSAAASPPAVSPAVGQTTAYSITGVETSSPCAAAAPIAAAICGSKDAAVSAASTRPVQPAAHKSWASAVRGGAPASATGDVPASSQAPRTVCSSGATVSKTRGAVGGGEECVVGNGLQVPKAQSTNAQTQLSSLGEQLQRNVVSYGLPAIIPRGLTNVGNWCYVHAPLQALVSLPGFHQLLRLLNPNPLLIKGNSITPVTDSMIQFFHEFTPLPKASEAPAQKTKKVSSKGDLVRGDSFKPECIYKMLQEIKSNFKGRQEDAEEFLGCVLNGLHEEMVAARLAITTAAAGSETNSEITAEVEATQDTGGGGGDSDEWEHVGPKNRSSVLRKALLKDSPIREIFGGELYCSVRKGPMAKESVVVEPFFSLQLDIQSENVKTVQQALEVLMTKELVQMTAGNNTEVEAHRRTTLASLPSVLILHLKRFLYNTNGGLQKLMKLVDYSVDLEISKDLLAPIVRPPKISAIQRGYRLWAVVYHHGNTASGGHYTCDVYHPLSGGWLHADDGNLKPVTEDHVLFKSQSGNKVAYLLFYVRTDLINTKQ